MEWKECRTLVEICWFKGPLQRCFFLQQVVMNKMLSPKCWKNGAYSCCCFREKRKNCL